MKDWKALVFLFGIVFIAGCTIPGISGGGGGAGLSMTLQLSDTTVEPNTNTYLTLKVQNNAEATATGITAQLMGLAPDWQVSPGTLIGIPDLTGTDPSHGQSQGQADVEVWNLAGPALSAQTPYQFSVRMTYNYQTSRNVVVRAASSSYYLQNKITTGIVSQSGTGGPISITVRVPNAVFAGSSFPIYVDFNNAGSGSVVGNTLNVAVTGSGISCQQNVVKLIPDSNNVGRTGFLRCTASTAGVSGWGQFTFSVYATYTYAIEQFQTITVNARAS